MPSIWIAFSQGLLADRPAATNANQGFFYLATDQNGGTFYQSNGVLWVQAAGPVIPPVVPAPAVTAQTVALGSIVATDGTQTTLLSTTPAAGDYLIGATVLLANNLIAGRIKAGATLRDSGGAALSGGSALLETNDGLAPGVRASGHISLGLVPVSTNGTVTYSLTFSTTNPGSDNIWALNHSDADIADNPPATYMTLVKVL